MRPNMMIGVVCVISAAAFAACQPSQPLDAAPTNAAPKVDAPKAAVAAKATQPKKAVAKADVKATATSKPATADAAPASMPVMESRPVAGKQQDEGISTTVTGCLELRDDGMFQLKDTDGEHAPKARSWKSGFIKKGAAKIDVFDAGNRLKLGSHVGYRVSITGRLTDRDLRARSLQSTSEACE